MLPSRSSPLNVALAVVRCGVVEKELAHTKRGRAVPRNFRREKRTTVCRRFRRQRRAVKMAPASSRPLRISPASQFFEHSFHSICPRRAVARISSPPASGNCVPWAILARSRGKNEEVPCFAVFTIAIRRTLQLAIPRITRNKLPSPRTTPLRS